ncbi:hypothetical protein GHT06_022492 [Daphnia sinensis]|uniref:Uncharacterized protein n=1 Tax=Daphnia sinensis TaxID=1820382 RepID=A0AAD5KYS3_9CRUS|nr:hypothetical protein GHT06_022492 [Daphnia sinensis]
MAKQHTGACFVEIDDLFTPARKTLPVPYISSYPALPTSSESTKILYIADETYLCES